ncbi:hypothetical protein BF1496 [Bacteroides fragilis YCH46]|uniref:Uncharacterized protein n=1 Tax=Bacteroides fragilis (strain YCH46) TaxID=295405 RepID=Q64W79_BACFR|nr:hypothetical protein BF1496 [Bacteroides fragilis YCH46]
MVTPFCRRGYTLSVGWLHPDHVFSCRTYNRLLEKGSTALLRNCTGCSLSDTLFLFFPLKLNAFLFWHKV